MMKKLNRTIIAGLSMLMAAATAVASVQAPTDGTGISENTQKPVRKYYMQVRCSQSAINQKMAVEINMGRLLPTMLGISEKDLQQASSRTFSSDIDAVNFYALKGWTLVDSYTMTQGRSTSVVYVMMFETADPREVGVSILTH